MANQDPNQTGQTNGGEVKLVEVEVDGGKKIKVPEEAKEFIMRDSDYRRKTQELARSKTELETNAAQNAEMVTAAQKINEVVQSDEVLKAYLQGDKKRAKALLADIEDEDALSLANKRIANVEAMLKEEQEKRKSGELTDFIKSEGRRMVQAETGFTDEDVAEEMQELRKANNSYAVWIKAAASKKMAAKAKAEGVEEGKKLAIEEWERKINNNRPVSDGDGNTPNEGIADTKQAAAMALRKIREAAR
jgi:hypothetical protein